MKNFIENLREEADKLKAIGDGESLIASQGYYGEEKAYRKIANKLEKEFLQS